MTKQQFFAKLASLYAVANASDSDGESREDWTHANMAGNAFCRKIDEAIKEMKACGVLTQDEADNWYEGL